MYSFILESRKKAQLNKRKYCEKMGEENKQTHKESKQNAKSKKIQKKNKISGGRRKTQNQKN